jgi:hypothetical protein
MSISLVISNENIPEEKWENTPIASEENFEKIWLPICEQLQLEYIPLFETGLDIDSGSLEEVMIELNHLKEELIKKKGINDTYIKSLERVNNLLKILPVAVKIYSQVFIG